MPPSERRSAPRLRLYLPIRLHEGGRLVAETLCKDIGMGGLRCVSPKMIAVGKEVRLEVSLPQGREVISCTGRTVWVQVLPESDQFDLGISFHDVPEKTKRLMSTCFERCSPLTSV
jgi:hypothetical protein